MRKPLLGDYSLKRATSGGDRWIVNKAPVSVKALFKRGWGNVHNVK